MKPSITFLLNALLLAGCASVPTESETHKAEGKPELHIVQMGSQQTTDFVFCESKKCPRRSAKYLHGNESRTSTKEVVDAKPVAKSEEKPAITKNIQAKVHFRWGWSRLDKAGHDEVRQLLKLEHVHTAREIVISGRTDPTGSDSFNSRLALRRAQTVQKELVKAGIPASRMTVKTHDPCCDGDVQASKEEMKTLRRTDIEITIKTP